MLTCTVHISKENPHDVVQNSDFKKIVHQSSRYHITFFSQNKVRLFVISQNPKNVQLMAVALFAKKARINMNQIFRELMKCCGGIFEIFLFVFCLKNISAQNVKTQKNVCGISYSKKMVNFEAFHWKFFIKHQTPYF